MQMENIFEKITIPNYSFFNFSINITDYLYDYLYNNLQDENYNILKWDLENTLTIHFNK
jgi:hypothetical protein